MNDVTPTAARLLIVDDEAAQMQALCDTLRDRGYEVTGCTTSVEALAALRQTPFDLLLTDLTMPDMDGITLLRAAIEIDPLLVGIIMTGDGTIATAVAAMQSGALDYILKPFNLSAIVPVLARGLAVRRLREENASLERRLRQRASELEAANCELDAFTRSVSHDLRTPLNAIVGFSELLSEEHAALLPAEARTMLNEIEAAGLRMTQLIDDLLRLSKLGHQALRLDNVELETLVRSVGNEVDRQFPNRNVELRIGSLPRTIADSSLLRQVFMNLLSNAYKFTRDQARARIEIGSEMQNGERVYYVRDNGTGFDMAEAERLFGVFQRLHNDAEFEGTGVGLTIVQRIVQRHGGRIWVQATPGEGASFCFTLAAGASNKI